MSLAYPNRDRSEQRNDPSRCPNCGGDGKVRGGPDNRVMECPHCQGDGVDPDFTPEFTCEICGVVLVLGACVDQLCPKCHDEMNIADQMR